MQIDSAGDCGEDREIMRLTLEMHDPQGTLLRELTYPGITQASVAITYAYVIAQEPEADFGPLNRAIRDRWPGKRALERVKTMAWHQMAEWHTRGIESTGK